MRLVVVLLLAACGRSEVDRERAAKLFTEVKLDTAPGLSGLATDPDGRLWTIAERDAKAYRITIDAANVPALETFDVQGIPPHLDLEGIAWLGHDQFALGTEGRESGTATVLLAELRGSALAVTSTIELPEEKIGIELPANHGAEGLCGEGDEIVVAIEGAGEANGRRYAPIVHIAHHEIIRTHRLWLTTKTGKISGLDCTVDPDGTAHVIAIERHFSVTKILRFTMPPTDGDITPVESLDLGPVLNSRLNLEGIAQTPNGRVFAVVDNQWKQLQGPSLLLVFQPDVVR